MSEQSGAAGETMTRAILRGVRNGLVLGVVLLPFLAFGQWITHTDNSLIGAFITIALIVACMGAVQEGLNEHWRRKDARTRRENKQVDFTVTIANSGTHLIIPMTREASEWSLENIPDEPWIGNGMVVKPDRAKDLLLEIQKAWLTFSVEFVGGTKSQAA